jgi:hypothetical protein
MTDAYQKLSIKKQKEIASFLAMTALKETQILKKNCKAVKLL